MKTRIDRGKAVKAKKRGSAFIAALLLVVLAALTLAGLASAKDLYLYEWEKSFNGGGSNVGAMSSNLSKVAVSNENGHVYVLDQHNGKGDITQFDENGNPAFWSALGGTNAIELSVPLRTNTSEDDDLIFDNRTGKHLGLFLLAAENNAGSLVSYNPDGSVRLAPFPHTAFGGTCGIGLSRDGVLYSGGGQFANMFDAETGTLIESGLDGSPWAEGAPCHNVWDLENNSWLSQSGTHGCFCEADRGLQKYGGPTEINFKFPNFAEPRIIVQPGAGNTPIKGVQGADIDESNDHLFTVEDGTEAQGGPAQVLEATDLGQPVLTFGAGTIHGATGIAVNSNNHKVYVTSQSPTPHIDIFKRNPTPVTVPDAVTLPAGHPDGVSATLRAEIDPAGGGTTTDCRFDWGPKTKYEFGTLPCKVNGTETNEISSPAEVTNGVASLTLGNQYHYRVATRNANGHWSFGADKLFEASTPPTTTPLLVEKINTDSGHFTANLNPHGGTTEWRFEIGTQDCSLGGCEVVDGGEGKLKSRLAAEQVQATALHIQPSTLYHVRLVVENGAGALERSLEFRTYPAPPTDDPCGNRAVRQQTGASLLLDCRAYELVSAANAGTYDVESDLVPLQTPFLASPNAHDRVLYGLHYGSIPNIAGDPPNYGLDPYVAERSGNGWVTRYVGIPAEGMADDEGYGSPLLGSDDSLSSFAFGGEGICDPCFAGAGTNIPVRLNGGAPVPGMVGDYSGPSEPEGTVVKSMSADGSHLVFGSEHAFASGGEEGELNLYSRNLSLGATELVSTDESGNALSDPGLAELDLSSDGSRVLVGEEASKEGENVYYQLFMHIAGNPDSVKLAPGPALFDGMTADGSRVFFTTKENLAGDTDESADIFEVDVAPNGTASSPRLVSTESDGTPSNDDSCTPPGSPTSWNAVTGEGKCNAVALAGGAGVASGSGTFYFLSPEQLEGGEGSANQPNLYVVAPDGHPHFVATIDSSEGKPTELPPNRPVETADLTGTTLSSPAGVAVDQNNGDVYVNESGTGKVARFTEAGAPHDFTAGPGAGTNEISDNVPTTESEIAVDGSGSPLSGDFYVAPNSGEIHVYAPSGEQDGSITGIGEACGVAVEQSTGAVYVGDYYGVIWRFMPKGTAAAPIDNTDYEKTGVHTTGMSPCNVAVDSAGHAYAMKWSNGPVKEFDVSLFTAAAPGNSGTAVDNEAAAISTDPVSNRLFVTEASGIAEFKPDGELVQKFGSSNSGGSRGVAINGGTHHVYVSSGGHIVEFGYAPPPVVLIDNPAVQHAVLDSGTHRMSDFQITPDGRYAAFASGRSLTGYPNNGHMEIYRYDTQGDQVECASCATTLAPAKTDTTLSPYGLNLTDEGKVFFTSREGLVLSDTNEKLDAYQWNGGLEIGKISTGRSPYDSKLFSVSADGTDAFFFTRDVLVDTDENGGAVKIYDARAGAGYLQTNAKLPCAASDECHGPGTPQPPPPDINSITGAGQPPAAEGEPEKTKCKRGFVHKHKKCVRKHRRHKRHGKHAGHNHRAGRNG
jgi:DNA-binding beta-propeller fold protein YncE